MEIKDKANSPCPKTEQEKPSSACESARQEKIKEYGEYDFVEKKSNKEDRKKMVKKRVLGINKDEELSKRQKTFKTIVTVVFIVFVLGVLAFTAYNDFFAADESREPFSWETLLDILSGSWIHLILMFLSLFMCYLLKGLKLSIMSKSLTNRWHFKTCFETAIIGHYFNNVTPLAVGGQPFEIYHLAKHGVDGGTATSLAIATYFLNQIALVILGVVGLSLMTINPLFSIFPALFKVMAIIGLVLCALLPILVLVFSLMPRVGAILVKFVISIGAKLKLVKNPKVTIAKTLKTVIHNGKCLKKISTRPHVFISSFLLSFLEQAAVVSIAYFALMFFGFNNDLVSTGIVGWAQIIQVCIVLNAAISFIPTPGNSGAADLSFYILFQSGLAVGLAFPAMMTWRLSSFYSFIIIGFIFATIKKKSDNKKLLRNQSLSD